MFLLCLRQLPRCGDLTPYSFPPPTKGRSSPTNTPIFPPSSFILPSFLWFHIFFSTGHVLLSLSWCSACTSVSEGVFLIYLWREMYSRSTYSSAIFILPPTFLKRNLVLLILLFSYISLHYSFKKAFLSLPAMLWNSTFSWLYLSFSPLLLASLLSSAICKVSSDNQFAFLNFFFFGGGNSFDHCLYPMLQFLSIVLQPFCVSDLVPWIYS